MNHYHVTVKTEGGKLEYPAIAMHAIDVVLAAIDEFGPCAVTVEAAK